jgi:hypothetical protein
MGRRGGGVKAKPTEPTPPADPRTCWASRPNGDTGVGFASATRKDSQVAAPGGRVSMSRSGSRGGSEPFGKVARRSRLEVGAWAVSHYFPQMMTGVLRRGQWLRRCAALALLVGYAASTAEATAGLVRDGSVHHESSAAATVHHETSRGDHGHEDSGTGAKHGSRHQHGTSSDHCTHAHGVGLPAACDFEILGGVHAVELPTVWQATALVAHFHFRPPKA